MTTTDPAWIAADWGTSRLRAWAMGARGQVLDRRVADLGMGGLAPGAFEPGLRETVAGWLPAGRTMPVVVCGMAGAREGWAEAGYATLPWMSGGAEGAVRARSCADLDVRILPGLRQDDPPDVMRGEETQIAGLLAARPGFAGWVVLPGTHSKWARVAGGQVLAFFTAMTGELFDLLATHSILRRVLAGAESAEIDWPMFDEALAGALADPGGLVTRLFGLRARALLRGLPPAALRARLSAELIGTEVAHARGRASGGQVALVGGGALLAAYARALAVAGVPAETFDAEAMTLAGLTAARETLAHA